MELEKKYIYQVYQCGSFSKAAEALFITQPALSIAIKKVEQEIGAAIFNRSQRPLTLTRIGELYLQHIKKEMLLEQQLRQQIDDIHGLKSGDLKIGGTHYMNAYLLPSYIAQFNTLYPNINITMAETSSDMLIEMLKDNKLDFTFSCDEDVVSEFDSYPTFSAHILLAVPQDVPCPAHRAQCSMTAADILARRHLAPDCPSVDLKDFATEPFILLRSGNNLHDRAMHFFREAGIKPTIKIELSQMATASRLAEAGFAATFLSDRLVTSESHLHFYRLSHPESHRIFHALTSPKRYLPAAVKAFIDCLR